jgi:CDP-diacylglycerol--glycerol-3-phosphate 3-phosphatidyltransferase
VCSLALVGAAIALGVVYLARLPFAAAPRYSRVDRAGGSWLLAKQTMQMGYWAMGPLARACIALGIGKNAVTWASLALGLGAGAALASGHPGAGAALGAASFSGDALDGMIARETGTASDGGEVLDAAVDRYTELFFLGGVALYGRLDAWMVGLAFAATAGAFMVSYSTAKAEALQVEAPRGAMRRQERALVLVLGAALSPLAAAAGAHRGLAHRVSDLPLIVALALVSVVGNASAVLRLLAVARAVRRPEGYGPDDGRRRPEGCGPSDHARRPANQTLPTDGHAAAGDTLR